MTPTDIFAHPSRPHERRHGPRGYATYEKYKPWLRDEFKFRCVYCLEREMWYPDRAASFSVEHVISQSQDAALVCEYTNLIYACTRCNSNRRDLPLLDPTVTAFGEHIRPGENGVVIGVTAEGQDLIDILHLNENPALKVRRHYAMLLALRERHPSDPEIATMYLEAFGFPDDMPDLRLKQKQGRNSRPGSEQSCYFALREAGSLPATY